MRILPGLACAAVAAAASASAQTVVLYDNLGSPSVNADSVTGSGPLADSFSTGGFSGTLADVSVLVGGSSDSSGSITVSLLSDAAASPDALLATLGTISDSQLTSDGGVFSFTSSVPLSASSRYWIELSASQSTGYWFYAADGSGTGVAQEFFANGRGVFPASDGPYQMEVIGQTAVPEPAAWSLMIIGVGLAGAAARRRRARGAQGDDAAAALLACEPA